MEMGVLVSSRSNNNISPWVDYWRSYGGLKALLGSWYLWGSLLGALVVFPLAYPDFYQLYPDLCLEYPIFYHISSNITWFDLTISIIPSMLGFTLAGYTIFLTFGDMKFVSSLMGVFRHNQNLAFTSPYKRFSASLAHFVIVQVFALIFAVWGNAWKITNSIPAVVGLWLFAYAIATALATTMAIFRLSRMLERATLENATKDHTNDGSRQDSTS